MFDLKQMFEEMLQQKRHIDELEKDLQVCRERMDNLIRGYMDTVQHLPNPNESPEGFFKEIAQMLNDIEPVEAQPPITRRW